MTTIGSLCSGGGGLDLAVEQVYSARTAWHTEIDPAASKVLAAHWLGVPNHGDLTTVDWSRVEPVDILTAGFPCQPVSVAGQRKGTSDDRWLWDDIADVIAVLRPKVVFLENVPGLLAGWGEITDALCLCGWVDRRRGLLIDHPHEQELHCDSTDPHVEEGGWSAGSDAEGLGRQHSPQRGPSSTRGTADPVAAIQGGRCGAVPGGDQPPFASQVRGGAAGALVPATASLGGHERTRSMGSEVSEARRSNVDSVSGVEREGSGTSGLWAQLHCPVCRWPLGESPDEPVRRSWMGAVLGSLAALGYVGRYRVVRAADAGAPHRRERVFIAAHAPGEGLETGRGRRPGSAAADTDGYAVRTSTVTVPRGNGEAVAGGAGAADGVELEDAVALLPTPRASDGKKGGPNQRGSSGDLALSAAVQPDRWGKYAAAVAHWETMLGRTAPSATQPGPRGGTRLSPLFVEWLMGLPAGHVTDHTKRNDALRILGNGVMPQQAELALRLLTNQCPVERGEQP